MALCLVAMHGETIYVGTKLWLRFYPSTPGMVMMEYNSKSFIIEMDKLFKFDSEHDIRVHKCTPTSFILDIKAPKSEFIAREFYHKTVEEANTIRKSR